MKWSSTDIHDFELIAYYDEDNIIDRTVSKKKKILIRVRSHYFIGNLPSISADISTIYCHLSQ